MDVCCSAWLPTATNTTTTTSTGTIHTTAATAAAAAATTTITTTTTIAAANNTTNTTNTTANDNNNDDNIIRARLSGNQPRHTHRLSRRWSTSRATSLWKNCEQALAIGKGFKASVWVARPSVAVSCQCGERS